MPRKFDPTRTLASRFPTLAAQWHRARNGPVTPDSVMASSPMTAWWQCSEGHEWTDRVGTRTAMPKWKKGDVAACPDCADFPERQVQHTYPGCEHTRTIQRKNVEKGQQSCWDCGGDPDPVKDAARLDAKRASALASYYRRKERAGPLSDEERSAQRSLVGFVKGARVELTANGLTWWREPMAAEIYFSTTTKDLSEWMDILSIPHKIVTRSGRRHGRYSVETGVWISTGDFHELKRWAPTFAQKIRLACR